MRSRHSRRAHELSIVPGLKQHRHEPVLEPQRFRVEDATAEGVVFQAALACEHRIAYTRAKDERPVKCLQETARGLDEHAVAHHDD
jgi:hypothetical protein